MKLLYSDLALERCGQDFLEKLPEVADKLTFLPNWLMCVMKNESSLKPQAFNKISKAAGLIQFMPNTAIALGTTTEQILKMSADKQLDLVYKYYLPYRRRINEAADLYTATFYPYCFGKPDSYVIGSEKGNSRSYLIAKQNPMFDVNKDGAITYGEFKAHIRSHTFKDLPAKEFSK